MFNILNSSIRFIIAKIINYQSLSNLYGDSFSLSQKLESKTKRLTSAQKEEQMMALWVILIPTLGTIVAIVWSFLSGLNLIDLEICGFMYFLTTLGITVGYHRLNTHHSFQVNKTIKVFLTIMGSMAVQGPILFWAATHRRHHKLSDRPEDIHSPVKGFGHAHMGWMLNHEPENWAKYVPDLLRDKLIFQLNQWYFYWVFLGLLIPTILGGLLHNSWQGCISGLLWGGFVRIFLVHHVTWSINSVCHLFGSRAYPTEDDSTNNWICGLLACGEGWHNNHHAFPNSARHGLEWWQIDVSYYLIYCLEKIGLAKNIKLPNKNSTKRWAIER